MTSKPEHASVQMASEPGSCPEQPRDGGIDETLIRWMLELTPEERLRAAQDMINTVWMLRNGE
jgi:hypothetical protein